ncbi:acetyl-coenzyme A synthetase 2-like, mitochondrial [Styela clava]
MWSRSKHSFFSVILGRCRINGKWNTKLAIPPIGKRHKSFLSTDMPEAANFPNINTYEDLYKFSIAHSDMFWGELAKSRLHWDQPFTRVSECNMHEGKIKWFADGKLNVSYNCVDRHANETPDKLALIWEKDQPNEVESVSYKELLSMVCRIANCLMAQGIKKGDCVTIYMPVSPTAVATMLACARIGAVHNVVFAGFSAEALAQRIQSSSSKMVITTDQGVRGGKVIELKRTVDDAVKTCPSVQTVLVSKRTGANVPMSEKDIDFDEAIVNENSWCEPVSMDSEDWLFTLYTSGSTGKPKGIVHSQAGYLLYATVTSKFVFDIQEGDIFGCVADIGWITGHSYVVYGPLSNGTTTVLFESTPTYPDPGRYWDMVQRIKLTQFYGAPTAIRLLLKHGDSWVKKYDRSSLRVLGSVGEPINHEAWEWYLSVVGENRCTVVDTWWQTETGGIMITPRPSGVDDAIEPAMPMRPFYGIQPALLDESKTEIQGNSVSGACCIKYPWPGMARTILGDHNRFIETYYKPYPGLYFSGDGANRTADGNYQITGRMDDVINVSGHRLGTAEVEDVIDEHHAVAESAVVGYPHDIKGEAPFAFLTLKENQNISAEDLEKELKQMIKEKISSFAIPDIFIVTDGLPKTRSGKIMRRILRKIAVEDTDNLGDVSTLADPSVVKKLVASRKILKT